MPNQAKNQLKKPKINYRFLIGIDTGVNTGICIYDRSTKKITLLASSMIHRCLSSVIDYHTRFPEKIFLRIEDARLRKWIPRQATERAERGRREGAGSVKRDAKIWEDFCKDCGIDFELVAPKDNKTKMTADFFRKMTGWAEQTNEHERDAAALVYGY